LLDLQYDSLSLRKKEGRRPWDFNYLYVLFYNFFNVSFDLKCILILNLNMRSNKILFFHAVSFIFRFLIGLYICFDVMSKTDAQIPFGSYKKIGDSLKLFERNEEPDWTLELWTPISISTARSINELETTVHLCRLNFKLYSANPHLYPMFRDLVALSDCHGDNAKSTSAKKLLKQLMKENGDSDGLRHIEPTGFVFHESRVGSTLVANLLGSDPFSMVFSESDPAASALLHCPSCSEEENIQLFRDVITLMGVSPFHKRMFFKFQSITTTKIQIALKAFPNTPWAFVFRQPVQVIIEQFISNSCYYSYLLNDNLLILIFVWKLRQ